LALLEQALELETSDPHGALASLEAHRDRFPDGSLAPEREVLTIRVLLRLGRRAEARARAARLLSSVRGSVFRQTVERMLEEVSMRRSPGRRVRTFSSGRTRRVPKDG
jgi:hypothetical protein